MMDYSYNVFGALPCATYDFYIDEIEAEKEWFGEGYDHYSERADDYCCADWRFDGYEVKKIRGLLPPELQYLTDDDLVKIRDSLVERLDVGHCCWCE